MAKPAPNKTPPEIEFFPEVEQGSESWWNLRKAIPTASCFSMVMANGRNGEVSMTRAKYMRVLAGEMLSGQRAEETIQTFAMLRGKEMEAEAREQYERKTLMKVERVGFVRRRLPSGRYTGCSPDGLIGKHKALEIKSMRPDLIIEMLERGAAIPPEHRWQVYGTMWIAGLQEVDLMIYYRGMPVSPLFTVVRNESEIKRLSEAVEVFDWELAKLFERIQNMRMRGVRS